MIGMNEEEVVRLFLKNGFQISKNALGLASKNPEIVISHFKKIKNRPFIITEQHIKEVLGEISKKPINVKLIKEYTFDRTPTSVDDYIKELSSRYEKIKSFLLKQMMPKKLVSINKIGLKTTKFSLIGLVREKNDISMLIEDPTGEINLYVDENIKGELKNVLLDDVVGVQCKKIKEKYYIEKIFYPDILSSRNISKTKDEIKIAVAHAPLDLTEPKCKKLVDHLSTIENLSVLFLFSYVEKAYTNNVFSKFNLIQILHNPVPKLFQLDEIKFLVVPKPFFEGYTEPVITSEIFLSILKRRELFAPAISKIQKHKKFILDDPPDIIISNFDGPFCQNYKGTTIISNSNPQKIFIANLKTREVHETSI